VVLSRGERVWVYDVKGVKYLDFLSGYSALNQGHCHPRLVKVISEQAGRLTLTARAFRNDQLPLLCREICELTGFDRILPMNSGAEAVETAIKAVRKWAYTVKGVEPDRAEIITFENNFHGRTIAVISCSTEPQYKANFGPLTPGFPVVPYGDIEAVKRAFTPNTAAVLIEPVQGEGGIIVPPEGYLKQVGDLCCAHNALLILDEIQSGLGRCGKLFAHYYEDVHPDGVIVGKALSGGFYPVSALLARDELMRVFKPGDHGSTFGGNPLACAIAREALRILLDENLPQRAHQLGDYFMDRLRSIKSRHIKEVRGRGLLIGVELVPQAGGARRFCEALEKEGLLCKETRENVLRFAPPLVIEKDELDWAFDRIKPVLESL